MLGIPREMIWNPGLHQPLFGIPRIPSNPFVGSLGIFSNFFLASLGIPKVTIWGSVGNPRVPIHLSRDPYRVLPIIPFLGSPIIRCDVRCAHRLACTGQELSSQAFQKGRLCILQYLRVCVCVLFHVLYLANV